MPGKCACPVDDGRRAVVLLANANGTYERIFGPRMIVHDLHSIGQVSAVTLYSNPCLPAAATGCQSKVRVDSRLTIVTMPTYGRYLQQDQQVWEQAKSTNRLTVNGCM